VVMWEKPLRKYSHWRTDNCIVAGWFIPVTIQVPPVERIKCENNSEKLEHLSPHIVSVTTISKNVPIGLSAVQNKIQEDHLGLPFDVFISDLMTVGTGS
jgi:hypothetical protein